jgi:hypothetical protein
VYGEVYGNKYFGYFEPGFMTSGTWDSSPLKPDQTEAFWISPLEDPNKTYIYYRKGTEKWRKTNGHLDGPAPDNVPRFTLDEILAIESAMM